MHRKCQEMEEVRREAKRASEAHQLINEDNSTGWTERSIRHRLETQHTATDTRGQKAEARLDPEVAHGPTTYETLPKERQENISAEIEELRKQ